MVCPDTEENNKDTDSAQQGLNDWTLAQGQHMQETEAGTSRKEESRNNLYRNNDRKMKFS